MNQHDASAREHAVVVVGGGPTGLMLAGELALAGVDVAIVERRADQSLDGSRAGGLHARTLEVLDQRGIVDRFVEAGQTHPALGYSGAAEFPRTTAPPVRHRSQGGLFCAETPRVASSPRTDRVRDKPAGGESGARPELTRNREAPRGLSRNAERGLD